MQTTNSGRRKQAVVKFVEVTPEDIDNLRAPHRGRVSYPILKGFLETGYFLSKLDRTGMQQNYQALYSSLTAYIRSHDLPIKIFSRQGEMYLMRLDIDENGKTIENWREVVNIDTAPLAITSDEVAKRFEEEKDQTTK